MPEAIGDIRARVRSAIVEAEQNPDFHSQLQSDPATALSRFGVNVSDVARVGADDPDPPDPGCADGTCFTSGCPATCYVTVCSPSGFLVDPGEQIVDPEKQVDPEQQVEGG